MIAANLDDLFARLDEIASEGYNFGFHIRFSRPSMVKMTYRQEWSEHYSENSFILMDPSVIWALRHDGYVRWSEIDIPDSLGVFEAAKNFGYRYGAAFGLGPSGSRTLGSCGRSDREFTDEEMAEILATVREIHDRMDGKTELKKKQHEALQLYGDGFTYDQICDQLKISRTALRNRLAGARRVLGVNTNQEAFQAALEQGKLTSRLYTGIIKGLPTDQE